MALTQAQEEVLCLIGHDAYGPGRETDLGRALALGDLINLGLVECETTSTPNLTARGRAELDRMLID